MELEPTLDMEELPFVVFYQCRMCTHLIFDDIEKMFLHLDDRHGAMIDCEELRTMVYSKGLRVGPPPPNSESSKMTEEILDQETGYVKNEEADTSLTDHEEDEINSAAIPDIIHHGQNGDEDFEENGIAYGDDNTFDDDENGEGEEQIELHDVKFHLKVQVEEEEEQLPDDDFDDATPPEAVVVQTNEEVYDSNEDTQEPEDDEELESLPQGYNYGDYDGYEEGEELNGQGYEEGEVLGEEEEEQEDDDPENDNGMYSSDNSQQHSLKLTYGYHCKFCGKFFSTQRGVESHEQHHKNQTSPPTPRPTHGGRLYPCKICKKAAFHSFKDLKQHVKTHTTERIHICKFCFSTFNNTASLTKHLTIHKRENPNKCFCGKTFVSANTLKIHKKIHSGVKPFVCTYFQCGRAFVTKSTLESHLRTHTGEKPYECGFCTSSFTTSSAKYRHERHVHKAHGDGAAP